ncbi:MAG: CHAT domain-containing protein [Campylobacterales bacterium]|nr:CHAT domain-containing protein [Campylobacterales bacterium]
MHLSFWILVLALLFPREAIAKSDTIAKLHHSIQSVVANIKASNATLEATLQQSIKNHRLEAIKANIAKAYLAIPRAYTQNFHFEKAIKHYLFIQDFAQGITQAKIYNEIGHCYQNLNRFEKAQYYLLQALQSKQEEAKKHNSLPLQLSIAKSYNNLGELYRFKGDYHKVFEYYAQSIEIRSHIVDELTKMDYNDSSTLNYLKDDLAKAYTNMGNYYGEVGDYNISLEYAQKAIDLRQKIGLNLADNYLNRGRTYHKDANLDQALSDYDLSLRLRPNDASKTNKEWEAHTYTYMAQIYNDKKAFEKAMQLAQKGRKLYEEILSSNSPYLAKSYQTIAQIYFAQKEYNPSRLLNTKALAIRQKVFIDNIDVATSHYYLSQDYFKLQDFDKALDHAMKSFELFMKNQQEHHRVLSHHQKRSYNAHYGAKAKFSNLFDIAYHYRQHLKDKRAKLEELNQNIFNKWLMFKGRLSSQEDTIAKLYQKVSTLKNNIETLKIKKSYLAKLYKEEYYDAKAMQQLTQKITKTRESITQLEKKLNQTDKILQELLALQNIYYQDIVTLLKPHQIYIDFARAQDGYYLFTIDKDARITFDRINAQDTKAIENNIRAFRKNNSLIVKDHTKANLATTQTYLLAIYQKLWAKYLHAKTKDKKSLIISPDGLLNFFPFEAIYDGQNYLIQKQNITYIPSAKHLMFNRKKLSAHENNTTIIAFGYPNYNKGVPSRRKKERCEIDTHTSTLPTKHQEGNATKYQEQSNFLISRSFNDFNQYYGCLEGSLEELEYIKKLYKNQAIIYQKNRATVENLLTIQSPNILHISTHGFFLKEVSNEYLMQSGLLFAGANRAKLQRDPHGIITAMSLSTLNLIDTNLVVLSACDTGLGKIENAEGVVGLPKAFIQAGAKNIIMSLWSVNDAKTATLMKKFYHHLHQDKKQNYIEALRQAKLKMINQHPYYWSGFVLSGI